MFLAIFKSVEIAKDVFVCAEAAEKSVASAFVSISLVLPWFLSEVVDKYRKK